MGVQTFDLRFAICREVSLLMTTAIVTC